ncbi:urease accessory protein UreD [Nocardioides jensenii]|uniref:urease accessory protein UreD n=1 Tax=Nocardioides jensenii TaxID=1843 RepID=UPI0008311814|nr:urease accessory protein UreD [Nocardioides jensenii]
MTTDAPLRILVERTPTHHRITRLDASRYVRPRAVHTEPDRVRVALVAACASLLSGDHVRLEIEVGPGAHLELVEPSATVAYNARGGSCTWSATIRVAEGGSLVWGGAPFVVSHGAEVERGTTIELGDGAAMLHHETLVLGRSAEDGGSVRSTLRATYDGRPLLVEDVDLSDPVLRSAPGVLGGHRVVATTTLLGLCPEASLAEHETLLAGPGALARSVADQAHVAEAVLAPTWQRWQADLIARTTSRNITATG